MSEINDPEKNNGKKGYFQLMIIDRFLSHPLLSLIFAGLLSFAAGAYLGSRHTVLSVYDKLQIDIEQLVFMDEDAYNFCANTKNSFSPKNKYLKEIELFKFHQKMSAQFEKITKNMRANGKLVSRDTISKIHQFTCWNNIVMSSPKGLCGSELLQPPAVMDKWKNQLILVLEKEKEEHSRFYNSLYDYFAILFTNVKNEVYAPAQCDFSKMPIYTSKK